MNTYIPKGQITYIKWKSSWKHKTYQDKSQKVENLYGPITSRVTDSVIKNFPKRKSFGPDGFIGEFYEKLNDELTPILFNLFQKYEDQGTLPYSFYEASITLIPKSDKDALRKLQNTTPYEQ